MADEIKDTNETKDPREKGADRTFDEEMADIQDTLDLKSPSEEESEERKESEEEVEEDSKGAEEEVVEDLKRGKDEKGELSEEEKELKEIDELEKEEVKEKEEVEEKEEETASVEDERDFYKAQNRKLLERLNADPLPLKKETPKPEEEKPELKPEVEIKLKPETEFKGFLEDGDDLDAITEDPEKFGEVLNRVRKQSMVDANKIMEGFLVSLPNLITKHVQRQNTINTILDEFYKENKDLAVVKKVVGEVANEVVAEDPSLSFQNVLDEAAVRTRKALGFKELAKKTEGNRRVRKPTFRTQTKRSVRDQGPSLTDLEADVADTLEL